jgi:integrase
MAQPYRHPSSGKFYIRRKVPVDLREALGREFKRSLGTVDPAVAKGLFAAAWSDSERAFALARSGLKGEATLSQDDIQALASQWFSAEVQKLERSKNFTDVLAAEWPIITDDGEEYTRYEALGKSDWADGDELVEIVAASVKEALRGQNLPLPPKDTAAFMQLQAAFRDRLLALSAFALKRHKGDWLFKPDIQPHDASAARVRSPVAGKRAMKLLDLFDLYAKNKTLTDGDIRSTRKTIADYRSVVRRFIELCGDLAVAQIDRAVILSYRAQLADTPAKGKGIRALNAAQLVEKARTENLPKLGEATIRNRLLAVSAVLSFGVRQGLLQENPVIAGGLGRAAAKAATKKAARTRKVKDYTKEELNLIFTSPIFGPDGWTPPRADFGRAWYWLPLLMFYTGARREELAQLKASDVRVGEEGVNFLDILDTQDETDGERGVKTEGSRRVIPLHADLIARGFLDYRDSVPPDGQLFPLLKPNPTGYYGQDPLP